MFYLLFLKLQTLKNICFSTFKKCIKISYSITNNLFIEFIKRHQNLSSETRGFPWIF